VLNDLQACILDLGSLHHSGSSLAVPTLSPPIWSADVDINIISGYLRMICSALYFYLPSTVVTLLLRAASITTAPKSDSL
jgi:hypothetical protein